MSRSVFLLALVVAGLGGPPACAQEKPLESDYFPRGLGTTWHYKVTSLEGPAKGKSHTITVRAMKHEKVDGTVRTLVKAVPPSGGYAGYFAVRTDGLYHYTSGEKETPVRLFKLPHGGSDKSVAIIRSADGSETARVTSTSTTAVVAVPAGKFDSICARVEWKSAAGSYVIRMWFAKNVGMVKWELEGTSVKELEKFEPAN